MQDIVEQIHQLYIIAEAMRVKAAFHAEANPGEALLEQLLAERTERIADRLGQATANTRVANPVKV